MQIKNYTVQNGKEQFLLSHKKVCWILQLYIFRYHCIRVDNSNGCTGQRQSWVLPWIESCLSGKHLQQNIIFFYTIRSWASAYLIKQYSLRCTCFEMNLIVIWFTSFQANTSSAFNIYPASSVSQNLRNSL